MNLFWDTSAVLSLIVRELHSEESVAAWHSSSMNLAWRWMKVEACAALSRRGGTTRQWAALEKLLEEFQYLDMNAEAFSEVAESNRVWKLRAADAGHVWCLKKAAFILPDIRMVCFDEEMIAVVRKLGLSIWAKQ
ncbi:MAG: type II toxin-antitoxin system VapC family toxin [Myxococcota bacterium]|jgi:uncharacterized protein with PIN domain